MEESSILYALILTILIELLVLRSLGEKRRRVLWSSVVINLLTNVSLNLYLLHNPSSLSVILLLESLVMVVEAAWYYLFIKNLKQATVYSVVCIAISFLTGMLIESILIVLEII